MKVQPNEKKMRIIGRIVSLILLAMTCVTGCHEDKLELSVSSLDFKFTGEQKSFEVISNLSWAMNCNESWVTLSPATGKDNSTITVTVEANPRKQARTAKITVSSGSFVETVTVNQDAFVPDLSVSEGTLNFAADAGEKSFNITSNTSWSVKSNATSWLTVSPASGSQDGKVTVKATANTATSERATDIAISWDGITIKISVTQAAAAANLTVSATSYSFSAAATTTRTFDITSNVSWTVKNNESWLSVTPTSGSNNRQITVSATSNTTILAREDNITVSGGGITRNIPVTQEAASPFLNVPNNSLTFTAGIGQNTFAINSNISWEVSCDADWVTLTPTSGSNDGTITVDVASHTSTTQRTATITVRGGSIVRTVSVRQGGVPALSVTPASLTFAGAASSRTLDIVSNVNWTASSPANWLQFSPATGSNNQRVTVDAEANNATTQRTATITVSGGGITQTVQVTQPPAPYIDLSKYTINLPNIPTGAETFTFSSNVNWTVSRSPSPSWFTSSPSSGMNNGAISVTAPPNSSTSERRGTITISGNGASETVTVIQAGAAATGSITFWTDRDDGCGWISVTISGHGSHSIHAYHKEEPTCGSFGTATFPDLPVGTYSYTATCTGRNWSGTVTRIGRCHMVLIK